jgi:uncharacterized protein
MRRALLLLSLTGCIQTDYGLFLGSRTDKYELPDNHIPAELLVPIWIDSTDDVRVAAFVAWQEDRESAPSLLYLHGQGANLDAYWPWVMRLWDSGFTVLAIDYRGFGRSTGDASEQGLYDDAAASYAYLRALPGVDATRAGIYGYSMGTAVASWLAVQTPPPLLLLEAPFTSMVDMIEGSSPYPMPADWSTDIEMDTLGRIDELRAPLVVTHGEDDVRVPYRMGKKVFAAAPEPKRFVSVPGASHSRAFLDGYVEIIAAFAEIAPDMTP